MILLIGPFAAVVGLVAIFFVLRRKSVDKRSMYSARRSQIEHKVRAARQRTLTPHGRSEKPGESPDQPAPTAASSFAPTQAAPGATYEPSAYEPPPATGLHAGRGAPEAPSSSPWDVGPTATPPGQFEAPVPPPPYEPPPNEEVWTPAPAPEPAPAPAPAPPPAPPPAPIEPARPATPAADPGAWSVVTEAKKSADPDEAQPKRKGKGKQEAPTGSWQMASGDAPDTEPDEVIKAPGQAVAIAQYAVLVVGLVAVLIGVLIMVASSPVR